MISFADSVTALAKADSSPLSYLLSPNQMIDNDYRLPTYIHASDVPQIPGIRRTAEDPVAEIEDGLGIDLEVSAASTSISVNGKPNGEVDRQKGNVNGGQGWVETPEAISPPADGLYPVLAIDCEMVRLSSSRSTTANLLPVGSFRRWARACSSLRCRLPIWGQYI